MIGTASLSFDQASEQVEGMVQQGHGVCTDGGCDRRRSTLRPHKAALWLLAWSLRALSRDTSSRRIDRPSSYNPPPSADAEV